MIKYNIIQDTKYSTLKECREEIQNRLNGGNQKIDNYDLKESINKGLNGKKNNLAQLCWYDFLLDAIKESDTIDIKIYSKRLNFKY